MATQTLKAPSGPRAGRNGESTRLSHCGGISKRGQQKQRLDKDGDLVMDLGSGMKGRGRGTNNQRDPHRATSNGSTTHGHPTTIKGTRTTKVDLASVQRSILRQMGEKAMPPKGSRTLARSTRQAEKDGKGNSTVGDLDQIKVYGLKESKAASNPGGGTKDLLNFLERKATAPNATTGETVRIKKVCLTSSAGSHRRRSFALSGPLSFHAKLSKRRPRYSSHAAFDFNGTCSSNAIRLANILVVTT